MYHIRKAKVSELEIIAQFQIAMAKETESLDLDIDTLRLGIESIFKNPEKGCYFFAVKDDNIAGSLMITYEWSDWRNREIWWIQSVFVDKKFRQKGVYTALYNHILQLIEKDPNVGGVRLYVDNRNSRAQKVYTNLGMDGGHYSVFEQMKTI